MKRNTLGVRLDEDIYETLRRLADADERSMSQFAAKIIGEAIRRLSPSCDGEADAGGFSPN